MLDEGEIVGLLLVWLAFMSLVGYYVVRIGLMLREQHVMERAYRLQLAMRMGKAVREMAETSES